MPLQNLASWPEPAQNIRLVAVERHVIPTWIGSYIMSILLLTGCAAAYTPPPLTTQHPAHPEAMAAAPMPQSHTLTDGAADLLMPPPAMPMAQSGMHDSSGLQGTAAARPASQHTVVGEGKVVAVVPSSHQIVLDHKAIAGFMDAMTMGYQVTPPSLMESVQAGDTVRFTIDTEKKAIVHLEKMP